MTFGEAFLALPDLFPARRSGEPWGERALALDLPGGPFVLRGLDAVQESRLLARWRDFTREPSSDAIELLVLRGSPQDFLEREIRGWEMTFDLEAAATVIRAAGYRWMALVEREPLAGALYLAERETPLFEGDVENTLRVLAAYRLLSTGGALFHSAGIVDGKAHLFFGRSGAGKSTLCAVSETEGREILSDELNALVHDDAGPRVERLPFAGDFGLRPGARRTAVPLRAVWRLEKGSTTAVEPVSRSAMAAQMAACAPYVNADPWLADRLLGVIDALLSGVPSYRLTFPKEGPVWSVVSAQVPS